MTPTDKSPRSLLCPYCNQDHAQDMERWCDVSDLQIKYLAVKQELEATKYDHNQMRGVLDNMKQELEAARAENYQERCKTQTKINLIEQMHFEEKNLLKQLADAKAQIKDYESALEWIIKNYSGDIKLEASRVLNKWSGK